MRILITSVGTATSVNLIKYFRQMDDIVVGTDINEKGMTAGSMLVDKYIKIPFAIEPTYISTLISIIKEEKIDVLIPVNDIEVYVVSKNIDKIRCKCIVPDTKTIEEIRDKFVCSSLAKEVGVNVPSIITSDDVKQKRILRDRIGVGSKGIVIYDEGKYCKQYNENEKFLQKCVEGTEYTVDVLANKSGEPIYIIPRERLEVKSGVATKVRITKDNEIIESTKTLLKRFRLPGFSNIQFIKDCNGKCWFIEINYRFSGCGAATLATCKDYLEIYKGVLLDQKNTNELNKNVRWDAIVTRYYEECVYEEGVY